MSDETDAFVQLQRRLLFAALLIAVTFSVGVTGYRVLGGPNHDWVAAIYMTANVVTTAGFREAVDLTHNRAGMLFTVGMLLFGAGTVVYSTSVITAFVVEGDLTEGFRRRRMRRAIEEMRQHYIVCGAGSTGTAVLRELVRTERPVVVVESDAERARRITDEFPGVPTLCDDFTDDQALVRAGIARAAGIVICTTIDKDSLVTTVTARQLNPHIRVIARVGSERGIARLRQAGADSVVSPAMIGGMRMVSELVRPSVVAFLDLMLRDTDRNLRVEEASIGAQCAFVGKTLGALDPHERANCLTLAVRLPGQSGYVYNPPDDTRVVPGLTLIVMGDPAGVRRLRELCEVGPVPGAGAAITSASDAAVRV